MKKIEQTPFYVIVDDVNRREFVKYDVMPYLVNKYKNLKKNERPTTFEDCKTSVMAWAKYMYWARCQYEIILSDWPCQQRHKKVDAYWQIENNIAIVTRVFMENVGLIPKYCE